MSGVIMRDAHDLIIRNMRMRTWLFHGIGIAITLAILVSPVVMKLERDLVVEAYSIAKAEFTTVLAKHELLVTLRSKPLTVGQALDVVDVVITQKEVPIPIVLAMIQQESEFNPKAVSNKGARGLMQVMPATWKLYVSHPILQEKKQMHEVALNMQVGLLFLSDLKRQFKDWKRALRAYQAGPAQADNKEYDWYANEVMAKAAKFKRFQEWQ